MPDLIRTEANQRVDLGDWQHTTDVIPDAVGRLVTAQLMTNPAGATKQWIVEGFRMDCPAGKQLRVTRGVALLARREAGQTYFGAVAAEGDVTKIVDITSFTPGLYGIYIRFEYIAGDVQNRIFWNPSGLGNEFSQSIATRLKANWSVRIELTTPGGEWTKIGEVNQATLAPPSTGITDQRRLYFEGAVSAAYQSGWSTDGGGGANDRSADRQLHGVRDFQTFTAAMRQSLEDIKGRGLRRWWDPDIGGMNVGFNAAPVEDRIAVGDAAFSLDYNAGNPRIIGDTAGGTDDVLYTRADQRWYFRWSGSNFISVGQTGVASHQTLGNKQSFLRQPFTVRSDRDGTSPLAEGFRIGWADISDVTISSDHAIGPDFLLIEKTDGAATVSGDIVFARTASGGAINALLILDGSSGHVVPGFNQLHDLGRSATRWREIFTQFITSDEVDFIPVVEPGAPTAGDAHVNVTSGLLSVYKDATLGWGRTVAKVLATTVDSTARTTTGNFNQSFTIPANSLRVGSVIRVRAFARVTVYGSGTVDFRWSFAGSTPVVTPTLSALGALVYDVQFVVRTIGAGGTYGFAGDSQVTGGSSFVVGSSASINTTIAQTFSPRIEISASATAVLQHLVVDISD